MEVPLVEQNQQKGKYKCGYEPSTKGYQLTNDTTTSSVVQAVESLTPYWKGGGVGI